MPGHDVVVPIGAAACGGARGWRQRSKVSMTTMCPPQEGHGGRISVLRVHHQAAAQRRATGGAFEVRPAGGAGEQPVMPHAVEPARQDTEPEAADELVGAERHHLLAIATIAAIVFVAVR